MLAITHTVTSAAIGASVSSVPFAFVLAFLFHLFADTLLHWNIYIDQHRWPYFWVALDVLGGLAVVYWLTPERFFSPPMLAAVIGGNAPDVWCGCIELLRKIRNKRIAVPMPYAPNPKPGGAFYRFHEGLQNETASPWRGLAMQVVLVAPAVWLIGLGR